MMNKQFQRVILYAREHRANKKVHETLQNVINFLFSKNIDVYVDHTTTIGLDLNLPILPRNMMGQLSDLIVVVGGDGSLLSAARMAVIVNVPVVGINRGRLGFLTDISPIELEEQLSLILDGQYCTEKRFLLSMSVGQDSLVSSDALNDIVLSRGASSYLVDFDVLVDEQFVSHYRSDGLIIATPTGSTAYALSAGGPIMHPQLDAIVIVPMFSHSLNSRPLVISSQSKIQLRINPNNEQALNISCDGHEAFLVHPGQIITIEKKLQQLQLLHPLSYNYYDTLRIKLGWGSRHVDFVKD